MLASDIKAIDVHAHYGVDLVGKKGFHIDFMRADVNEVIRRADLSNIKLSIASPFEGLFPRFGADSVLANEHARVDLANNEKLFQWVIVDPLKDQTFCQAEQMLPLPQCMGIKIHPEEHGYHIKDHGKKLFEFAAKHKAVVLTHSGEGNSMPEDFVPFVDVYPEITLILAHLGCSCDEDKTHQIRAIQIGKYDNIFVDTSSSSNIMPGLIEWAVKQVGAEKILFGTDNPLYFVPMQRARIDSAEISYDDKKKILSDNAIRLFRLMM